MYPTRLDTVQDNSSPKRPATTRDLNPHHRTLLQHLRHTDAYIRCVHLPLISFALVESCVSRSEIQELRHKSQSSGDLTAATGVIDQALMALDERLESVARGVKTVNDMLEPLLQSAPTPTPDASNEEPAESVLLLRKHATFMSEWESVQEETEVLREELKEDKWLTVFRTVTEQADGMMSSLEKAITRCQVSDTTWPCGELSDNMFPRISFGSFNDMAPTIQYPPPPP